MFVAEEDGAAKVARKRYVTIGQVYDGTAEVKEGLREGDRVITVGFQSVEDGDAVAF